MVVFYEHLPILNRPFLHRFIIAQAKEFMSIGATIMFCTGDNSSLLQKEFLDVNLSGAIAVNVADKIGCCKIIPKAVFTSSINSVPRLVFNNPFTGRNYVKILWYGGILPEESFLKRESYLRKFILFCMEQLALRLADAVLLPSDSMREYLREHNRLPRNRYLTVPNAIDTIPPIFFGSRELWGINDSSPTIGYCGGISSWQCFEETAILVADLQRIFPELWFLILTYSPNKAQEILQRQKVSRFIIRTSAPEETHRYVQAFDLGLLLRRPHPINSVSFPLKYLDYMSNGVPVCTTSAVDSIKEDAENNHGLLIDVDRDESHRVIDHIEKCVMNRQVIRNELRDHAAQRWTWEKINRECRELYVDVMKK